MYAIGADVNHEIPGLYWLNYFGGPYVELIGRERLLLAGLRSEAGGRWRIDSARRVGRSWQSRAYRREQAVIAHLGKQYFFRVTIPTAKRSPRTFATTTAGSKKPGMQRAWTANRSPGGHGVEAARVAVGEEPLRPSPALLRTERPPNAAVSPGAA